MAGKRERRTRLTVNRNHRLASQQRGAAATATATEPPAGLQFGVGGGGLESTLPDGDDPVPRHGPSMPL